VPITRLSKQAQVYRATINAGPGEWTKTGDLRDIQGRKTEPDEVLCYTPEMTIDLAWEPGDQFYTELIKDVYKADVLKVQYKAGNQWFQPTITMDNAYLDQFRTEEVENGLNAWLDVRAANLIVEWPNRWARPVFWLWRRWQRFKEFVRRIGEAITERLDNGSSID